MKPLLFLTGRTLVNRVRRAFSSPKRLISLLVILAYYFVLLMRPMDEPYRARHQHLPSGMLFDLPSMDVLQAFAFAGFAFLTLILALSSSVQRLSFRPADVDVLFATPLSPRLVLIFRFVRDYLISLLIPVLPILFAWRPTAEGFRMFFRNFPNAHSAGYVFKTATLAWLLVALAWVSISYAISLFINRNDLVSDRNKKIIMFGGAAAIIALGGYVAWRWSALSGMPGFVALTEDKLLRVCLFTATAGSTMVMAPLQGDWLPFYTSALGLLIIAGGAVLIATSQADWMYDQAAARGFDSLRLRSLQQKGDLIGMAAERARTKKGKAKSFSWAMRIKARGPLAILWREVLIQLRMSPIMLFIFVALGIMFGIIPFMVSSVDPIDAGYKFLGMQFLICFVGSMSISQSGFIELLRRVDVEKPLPFSPPVISFSEVVAKALPSVLSLLIASIVCLIIQPALWPYCVASLVGLPFVAVLCCSIIFLVTLLFPDLEDPTLRGFRGLMILLGLAVALLPIFISVFAIGLLFRGVPLMPVISSAAGGVIAIGISIVVCLISGGLYAQFNPSE